MVFQFLYGLNADLWLLQDFLMSSDNVPILSNALFRILRVTIGRAESTLFDSSVSQASYGRRGRSRGRGHRKGHAIHNRNSECCGQFNHDSDKWWEKFGKSDWANTNSNVPSSSPTLDMVSVPRVDNDVLLQSSNNSCTFADPIVLSLGKS